MNRIPFFGQFDMWIGVVILCVVFYVVGFWTIFFICKNLFYYPNLPQLARNIDFQDKTGAFPYNGWVRRADTRWIAYDRRKRGLTFLAKLLLPD